MMRSTPACTIPTPSTSFTFLPLFFSIFAFVLPQALKVMSCSARFGTRFDAGLSGVSICNPGP